VKQVKLSRALGVANAAFLLSTLLALTWARAFAQTPQIASVSFSSGSPYTLTIAGAGFGQPTVPLPYTGDVSNFRVGDNAQLGHGEWGYIGDSNVLKYESWSDTSITVSGFGGNAGDSIGVAVWNSSSGIGATWGGNVPSTSVQITGVELWGSSSNLWIIVNGSGFGSQPWTGSNGFSGDLNFFEFIDFRTHCGASSSLFNAGGSRFGHGSDPVNLNYQKWSDTLIIIEGFGSGYGQSCATYQTGDPITIAVWNTNDTDDTGPQASFSGQGSTVTGVVNSVQISAVTVNSDQTCEPSGNNCFSIQQNFYVSTPTSTNEPTYWFQNAVQLAQVSGTWQARPVYCIENLLSGRGVQCDASARWVLLTQGFPQILLESTVTSGILSDIVHMTTLLGSGNNDSKTYPIPNGSYIVGAPSAQEGTGGGSVNGAIPPGYEPELLFVGEENGAVATFSSPTSGSVISGLGTLGGVLGQPGAAAPTTASCSSTQEHGQGLSWLVDQYTPARAGFSATGTEAEEGVKYVPALVASGLSTCIE
jgi:hypothetical protein